MSLSMNERERVGRGKGEDQRKGYISVLSSRF